MTSSDVLTRINENVEGKLRTLPGTWDYLYTTV